MHPEIAAAVERALEAERKEGIEGWWAANPDRDLFDKVEVGQGGWCTSRTCQHVSHDPLGPVYRLIPRGGRELIRLGTSADFRSDYTWYLLVGGNEDQVACIRKETRVAYGDEIELVSLDEVPAVVWLTFAKGGS